MNIRCVFFLILSLPALLHGQSFNVQSYSPVAHSNVPAENIEINVIFNMSVDVSSITEQTFSVFGRWAGVCTGQFSFHDNNTRIKLLLAEKPSAGEWITISLSRAIQSSTGQNLSQGFSWNFWTRAKSGSFDLQRTQVISVREPKSEERIRTYGAYAGDLNGDGFHDFTVPNEDASDIRVFLNDGQGNYQNFQKYSLPPNSFPSTNEGADFNGDGFLDFAVGNISGNTVSVFMGNGTGILSLNASYPVGNGTRGLSVIDLNCDGSPDLVSTNRIGSNVALLENNGDGTFKNAVLLDAQVDGETSCAAADFNEDGIMDLAVSGFVSSEMVILTGDGSGALHHSAKAPLGGVGWMIAAGDLNNDRHVDIVSANASNHSFSVVFGDGNGGIGEATSYQTNLFPLAIDVGDIDGDGDLDVVTSGFFSGTWDIFENDGLGSFQKINTLDALQAGSCAVLHDRDRDGDLDMTGIDELDDQLFLFENPGTPSRVVDAEIPDAFLLLQSYPNPFHKSSPNNPKITIPFTLQKSTTVKIEIINTLGQSLKTIIDRPFLKGRHSVAFAPDELPSGIYFYRMVTSDNIQQTRRLLLIR